MGESKFKKTCDFDSKREMFIHNGQIQLVFVRVSRTKNNEKARKFMNRLVEKMRLSQE